jgi:dephospho-CoA kinase
MLRVGLTGGIGSGKSTVAGRLAAHGAVVIDADKLAREVVEPATEGLAALVTAFGEEILTADGALDRPRLASIAFSDDEQRAKLNAIVHPLVAARTAELFARAADDAIVVHDVPLLVENGLAPVYNLVLVVHAEVDQRVARLVSQRGMPERDARARIAAQATDEQRRAVADRWLDNSGAPEQVLGTVDRLWKDRLVPYEENLRLRRAPRFGAPRLVAADPGWPAAADRLAARIRTHVGGAAIRVDHVGSTSVPGLAAGDVIELQLAVRSLQGSAADPGLGAAGFVRLAPVDGSPGPAAEARYAAADPERPAIVHVREFDSSAWREALLARDWLRAEAESRAEYQRLTQRLATEHAGDPDPAAYLAETRRWLRTALPRMLRWADETGWRP